MLFPLLNSIGCQVEPGRNSQPSDERLWRSAYDGLRVVPAKGMALLFYHPIPHRGDPVIAGRKYVLRSDIMENGLHK